MNEKNDDVGYLVISDTETTKMGQRKSTISLKPSIT